MKNILLAIGAVLFVVGVVTILYWNRSLKNQVQIRTKKINQQVIELEKLSDLKNKFLGMAAHDLRNPLTSVMGFTDLILEMDFENDKKREFLIIIQQESKQMLDLINDLLDVSVIESGKFDIVLRSENLKEVIESRIKLVSLSAKSKRIQIASDLEDVNEIKFDKNRISQVLDNLLSNAIKFSEPETTIHVTLASSVDKVSFHIRDQGPGITPEEVPMLFSEFEKLSNRPTAGEKSTGLGMAIVKKIIDGHKGQISVQSEVGKGTEFTVSLRIS